MLLTLRSGRNRISTGTIKLSCIPGISFQTKDAEVTISGANRSVCNFFQNNNCVMFAEGASVECTEESLEVSNMEKESQIQIRVPHAYHAAAEALVCFLISYSCSLLAL